MNRFANFRTLGVLAATALVLPMLISSAAVADSTYTETTTTTTSSLPATGCTTTSITTEDGNLQPVITTERSGGMLYTTTMTPTLQVDAFHMGRTDAWDREGYGDLYDLNRGFDYTSVNGYNTRVDLTGNRSIINMRGDALYHPATLLSDEFSRGSDDAYRVTQFDAKSVSIETGTTVTFVARSGHYDVMQLDGPVNMPAGGATIDAGRTFSHTFYTPGNYRFEDGFGGGPVGNESPGLIIHVHGPQRYAYLETTAIVATMDTTTTVVTEEKQTDTTIETVTAPPPAVQVEAAKPAPKVVKARVLRNKDIK